MASTSKNFQEFKTLKRLDIVNFLSDQKIKPNTEEYKGKYVEYLCSKYFIEEKEVPSNIYYDIYLIKKYFSEARSEFPRMIKNDQRFFDAEIKIKRVPVVPPPMVFKFFFKMSHKVVM